MKRAELHIQFLHLAAIDPALNSKHLTVYQCLLAYWAMLRYRNPFPLDKELLQAFTKISAKSSFNRILKELAQQEYIRYSPSNSRHHRSLIQMKSLSDRTEKSFPKTSENINSYDDFTDSNSTPISQKAIGYRLTTRSVESYRLIFDSIDPVYRLKYDNIQRVYRLIFVSINAYRLIYVSIESGENNSLKQSQTSNIQNYGKNKKRVPTALNHDKNEKMHHYTNTLHNNSNNKNSIESNAQVGARTREAKKNESTQSHDKHTSHHIQSSKPHQQKSIQWKPPTTEELFQFMKQFCQQKTGDTTSNYNWHLSEGTIRGEAEKFINYYETMDWTIGSTKRKMKAWQPAARSWLLNYHKFKKNETTSRNLSTLRPDHLHSQNDRKKDYNEPL